MLVHIIDKILEYYLHYSQNFKKIIPADITVLYKSTKYWNSFDPHCIYSCTRIFTKISNVPKYVLQQ
jgi:hypothetical protein